MELSEKKFAEVIINNKCRETDRTFSYKLPGELMEAAVIGSRVIVPFGAGNKQVEGYIVGFTGSIAFDENKAKQIIKLVDDKPVISEKLIELAEWMKEKYLCYYLDALHTIIPTPVRTKTSYILELNPETEAEGVLAGKGSERLYEIIEYIEGSGGKAGLNDVKTYFNDNKIDYYIKKLQEMHIVTKKQSIREKTSIRTEKLLYLNTETDIKLRKGAGKQQEIIDIIASRPGITYTELREQLGASDSAVKALVGKGYIRIEEKEAFRVVNDREYSDPRHTLTQEQVDAIARIKEFMASDKNVLLHGVTGSGKTEIYLELMEELIKEDKASILLVPEISLTPQMIGRVKGRFGDNVAVLHSGLSEGEKYDEWRRIRQGLVKVAVGARSAVFAPFSRLGMIIIDEEHETTYKSEVKPKYITREVAEKRCSLEGAHLLLGSATPSVETYYRTQTGELGLVELLNRANGKPMPEVEVVDMREELKSGNKTIFSNSLAEGITSTLKNGDQLLLFLNRRGHSTFVSCRQCGLVMKCPRCSISLTYHINENKLTCHYCGYERPNPPVCPKCQSKSIRFFGVGTQKVEKEFIKTFGVDNILRMDADTTNRKNSHERILDSFRNGESRVLLGTQMISKGLDFPNVTLVGIITADTSLNMPDFRAAERTFQMIAQVAGRSGRGSKTGKVIVQTYSPDHYSILYARKHDYKGFYAEEIMLRKELGYPPFSHIANILISGTVEQQVIRQAYEIGILLDAGLKGQEGIELLGPAAAPMSKIKNRYRWQIVLKGKDEAQLRDILKRLQNSSLSDTNGVNVSIDLSPLNML